MCLVPALGAGRPGLCLQVVSGKIRPFISRTVTSGSANSFQLQITLILAADVLSTFHLLTGFTGYLRSLNCFSYQFQVFIFSYDFIAKLDIACFDYCHHDDCIVNYIRFLQLLAR